MNTKLLTTKELAKQENVKVKTIRTIFCEKGHYRNYVPVGFHKNDKVGANSYLWSKNEN